MALRIPAFLLLVVSILWFAGGAVAPPQHVLPGTLPTIDAANYPTLQAAFDAVSQQGGMVRLPAGTFEISQPLRIHGDDVCVEGAGTATHIRNTNQDGLPALVIADPEHRRDGNSRQQELWRVRLANFRITGNEASGDGIVAHNINELFLDGVTVSYHGGDGIELSYCYEDARIVNALITYNKQTGLNLVGCHDIVVSANQFEENQDAVHCFDGFNLCMTGNCLDDHLGRGVVIENTYGSVVSGNMIEECQAAALVMGRDCYGNTVSANVIAHNGAGVDLQDAHGCAISANTFTIMKTDAIRVGPDSGRIAICANSFSDSYVGGSLKRQANDLEAAGIVIDQAADVFVSGNTFTGVKPASIGFAGSNFPASTAITNNYFVDTNPGVDTEPTSDTLTRDNIALRKNAE